MRRSILFGISLLALSIPGWADKVTPEQAAAVAERFLSSESPVTKSSQGAIRLTGTWPEARTKSAAQEPALYLFERDGGGFVVMAADDVSQPVIGYSTTARLSNGELPCNLRYILDWHASMIDYARTKGLAASSATKAQWQSTKGNEGEEVHLETAQWDQEGLPWNAMIPKVGGEECPVGCVATAIAIIMRYHQWPNKGTGTLPGYYWPGGGMEMEALALDHEYDWSQMPLIYEPGQYTEEQEHQIAQLLYDLAIMCKMDFNPIGSMSYASTTLYLTDYFGYDKQILYLMRKYHPDTDIWEGMIRAEIEADRPVFYSGHYGDLGGHAFVVDGYKGPYFSFNYGWSGWGNGYYLLRPSVDVNPEEVTWFYANQGMVSHIYPDRGGEGYISFIDDRLVPFPWDFRSKSFPVGARTLQYYWTEDREASLAFVLFDREGRFKEKTGETLRVTSSNPSIPEITCTITCDIEEGDCLKLAQLVDDQWVPIQQSANAYMEFHPGQKITDLVSLDFSLGDVDYPEDSKDPYLYLRGVKEIYWEMWSEDKGVCLATSQSTYSEQVIDGKSYIMGLRWNRDKNEFRAVFQYEPGNYRLFLRNFDEEMTLYIKL
jgi:hypothetical protein